MEGVPRGLGLTQLLHGDSDSDSDDDDDKPGSFKMSDSMFMNTMPAVKSQPVSRYYSTIVRLYWFNGARR